MMRSAKRLREFHVVDVDDAPGCARAGELAHQLHDLDRGLRIERRGRLVGQQQVRAAASPRGRCRRAGAGRPRARRRAGWRSSARPTASSSSKARSMSCRRKPPQPGLPAPARSRAARTAGSPSRSGARPGCIPGTPCRCAGARARSGRPRSLAMSSPSNRISPAVGSTSRLMQRISVDLPVPTAR